MTGEMSGEVVIQQLGTSKQFTRKQLTANLRLPPQEQQVSFHFMWHFQKLQVYPLLFAQRTKQQMTFAAPYLSTGKSSTPTPAKEHRTPTLTPTLSAETSMVNTTTIQTSSGTQMYELATGHRKTDNKSISVTSLRADVSTEKGTVNLATNPRPMWEYL